MALARRPPRRTRPKPVKKKDKRVGLDVAWGPDDNDLSKLTVPKNAKVAKGVRWVCDVCGAKWPAFVTRGGHFVHAKECRDRRETPIANAGCPSCAPGIVDDVAASMPRYEFDPVECPDLAERGVGLTEGEFAVSWQFKYPPYVPEKVEDDLTGMGKGVTFQMLNPSALAPQHKYKAYQRGLRPRYFAPPVRMKLANGEWVDEPGKTDEEVLDQPEGRIVRNLTDAQYVNRRLHPSHRINFNVSDGKGEARPRKYLRVVDHTGTVWSFSDMLEHFDATVDDRDVIVTNTGRLLVLDDMLTPKREPIEGDELRAVFKLITGVEMTDERGADLDKTPLPYPVLSRRVRAAEAFEARREAIRKDGAPHEPARLFHGTCAHNVRSILKHGLEPSTWAVNSALGPGIYLGELPKARSFSHPCHALHFVEGFVEGERVGRRFRGKFQTSAVKVALTGPVTQSLVTPATNANSWNITQQYTKNITVLTPFLSSLCSADFDLNGAEGKKFEETCRFFVEQLRDEFGAEEWDRLVSKKTPSNLLDVWSGGRPGRIERRWQKKNVLHRVRFVFEVDALLGNSYRITNPDDVVNNDTPRRFAFRRGSHSVYCTRFKQDEWCVYRTDQVHIRRINVYVDDEGSR